MTTILLVEGVSVSASPNDNEGAVVDTAEGGSVGTSLLSEDDLAEPLKEPNMAEDGLLALVLILRAGLAILGASVTGEADWISSLGRELISVNAVSNEGRRLCLLRRYRSMVAECPYTAGESLSVKKQKA